MAKSDKSIKNLLEKDVQFSKVSNAVKRHIVNLNSNNAEFMSSNGLTSQVPTFGNKLEDNLMSVYNYDGVSYAQLRLTHPVLKISETMKKPLNALLLLSAMQSNVSTSDKYIFLDFLVFKLYTSKFKKYWAFVLPEVMEDTYMSLSNRYTIKQVKTVSKYFRHITETSVANFKKRLDRLDDQDIIDFINDLSNKLNSYLNSVRSEYANANKVYKSQTVRGEDIIITNENQTNKFDKIIYHVTNEEITKGCNVATLKLCKGTEFLADINNGYAKGPNIISEIVSLIMNDYNKKYGNASTNIKRDFITYASTGRNKDPRVKDVIISLLVDDKVNKVKFYNVYYKYITTRIYRVMDENDL